MPWSLGLSWGEVTVEPPPASFPIFQDFDGLSVLPDGWVADESYEPPVFHSDGVDGGGSGGGMARLQLVFPGVDVPAGNLTVILHAIAPDTDFQTVGFEISGYDPDTSDFTFFDVNNWPYFGPWKLGDANDGTVYVSQTIDPPDDTHELWVAAVLSNTTMTIYTADSTNNLHASESATAVERWLEQIDLNLDGRIRQVYIATTALTQTEVETVWTDMMGWRHMPSSVSMDVVVPSGGAGLTWATAIGVHAYISGLVNPQLGATVTFDLYGPGDTDCSGTPVWSTTVLYDTSVGAITYGRNSYADGDFYYPYGDAGTYRMVATYNGDSSNLPISSGCDAATIIITAQTLPTPIVAQNFAGLSEAPTGWTTEGSVTFDSNGASSDSDGALITPYSFDIDNDMTVIFGSFGLQDGAVGDPGSVEALVVTAGEVHCFYSAISRDAFVIGRDGGEFGFPYSDGASEMWASVAFNGGNASQQYRNSNVLGGSDSSSGVGSGSGPYTECRIRINLHDAGISDIRVYPALTALQVKEAMWQMGWPALR